MLAAAELAGIKKTLLEDPVLFIEFFSGLRIDAFQRLVLRTVTLEKRLILLLPATHGKSTLIAKWYVIWRICQNPNIRIIVVMKSDKEVQQYAGGIRAELAGNHKLIKFFGPFVPTGREAKWTNDAFNVRGRQIREVQPTVEFASSKSIDQVLGHRCDEFLCDDIVTPKSINTQELRDEQENQFSMGIDTGPVYLWDQVLGEDGEPELDSEGFVQFINKPDDIYWPRLKPYGVPIFYEKSLLEGTVFHVDDLFHRKGGSPLEMTPGVLYKGNDPTFKVMYFDCYKHDENNEPTDEPLWAARWTLRKLREKEATMGAQNFARRFRNIALDEGSTVFKRFWITGGDLGDVEFPGCYNRVRSFGELPPTPPEHDPKWFWSLGVDPSTGRKNEGASWTAFVLLAVDLRAPVRKRYLMDVYREQMGFEDIQSWMLDGDKFASPPIEGFWTQYKYNIGVIEKTSAQNWFMLSPRRSSFEMEHPVKLVGMDTQAGNKWDPISGVSSMQSMVRDGLLDIPYATPTDKEKARQFVEQLLSFPMGIYDYAMAMWFANLGINDSQPKYRSWARGPARYEPNPYYHRYS